MLKDTEVNGLCELYIKKMIKNLSGRDKKVTVEKISDNSKISPEYDFSLLFRISNSVRSSTLRVDMSRGGFSISDSIF